jgi:hypothetical protein
VSNPVSDCEPPSPREIIIARLEAAGATLLALRLSAGPRGHRSGWPDYVRDAMESYGWENAHGESPPLRAAIPSASDITAMDEAFSWIGHIPGDRVVLRRIIHARALVNPLTDRHLFSWRRVGRLVGADHRAVQRWHDQAITLIWRALAGKNFPCQTVQNMTVNCLPSRDRAAA